MIKKLNDKTYYKKEDLWYGTDKNGNEYKIFSDKLLNKLNESEGLGDTIGKVTSFLGIKECKPCKKRKEVLNKLFPWTKKQDIRLLTEEEIEFIDRIKYLNRMEGIDVGKLFKLYNDVFKQQLVICVCPGLVNVMRERLIMVMENQKELNE